MMNGDHEWGALAPSNLQTMARNLAVQMPNNWLGQRINILMRQFTGAKLKRPYDVEVFGPMKARLHPYDNICEKRVYSAPQYWDWEERSVLSASIRASKKEELAFVDLGANVGLYSLFVAAVAQKAKRSSKIMAIEPDPFIRERLEFNLAASGLETAKVFPHAITSKREKVSLYIDQSNRGANSLVSKDGEKIEVEGYPLVQALDMSGFDRIDILKIDIEGMEYPILKAFFDTAPKTLWPELMIMESLMDNPEESSVQLAIDHGYRIHAQTRMNAVLKLSKD